MSIYVTSVVNDEKNGAKNTQTFRISMVIFRSHIRRYKAADVIINPKRFFYIVEKTFISIRNVSILPG